MNISLPNTIVTYEDAKEYLRRLRDVELNLQLRGVNQRAHFRGEEDVSYLLKPKIARYGHTLDEMLKIEPMLLKELEEQLTNSGLMKHIRDGFIKAYPYHSEWLFVQQAQHLGLATRFLDWSLKYEVGLFFASRNLSPTDGKLYTYIPTSDAFQADRKDDKYAHVHPWDIKEMVFLNPTDFLDDSYLTKIAQRFRSRQHGRFLISPSLSLPYDLSPELNDNFLLHPITIPSGSKASILEAIDKEEGINEETMFIHDEPAIVAFKAEIKDMVEAIHKKHLY